MKNRLTIIIASLIFLGSCAERDENLTVVESYGFIYNSFQLSRDAHRNFVDRCIQSLDSIKYNEDHKVDTKELRVLLDSAKSTNQNSLYFINLAGENDTIKYKEKAIKYIKLLNNLYNNEFKKCITVLHDESKDRYEKANQLLQSRQVELNKLSEAFQEAAGEIREKYHLQNIVDSLQSIN